MNFVNKQNVKLNRLHILILYFFIFAFIGWCMETLYAIYNLGFFVKRGFLYGPLCPIYGFGAVIMITFLGKYKRNSIKLFLYASILFSLFEYIAGFALDALFSARWWDYTDEFFNLNGRISIYYSFVWGIISLLFINFIYPFFKKHINVLITKIPYIYSTLIINILTLILIFDFSFSCVKYLT